MLTACLSASANTEVSVWDEVSVQDVTESATIKYQSGGCTKTFDVTKVYSLTGEQPVNTTYDYVIFRLPYADMATAIGFDVNEWLNKTTAIADMLYFPLTTAGEYCHNNDNWYNADGTRSSYGDANSRFYIQQQRSTELEQGNFIFWVGQHGGHVSSVGDVYTSTFYLVNEVTLKAIRFDLKLCVVSANDYPTEMSRSKLDVVGSTTVDVDFYPMSDGWATHTRNNLPLDENGKKVSELIKTKSTYFSLDMMYAPLSDESVCRTKTASDNKGFWLQKSDMEPGELLNQTSWNESMARLFLNVEGFYWPDHLSIGFGQRPRSMTSGTYVARVYMLACHDTETGTRRAYEFVLRFNLSPATIDEGTDYALEHADITEMKLIRTLKAGMHNTVVLPFKLTQSLAEQVFGSGSTMEVITEYADNELKTEITTEVEAHQPFLLIPTSPREDKTYLINCTQGTKTVDGNAGTATFTNGSLVGTYAPINIEASTIAGIANYVISNDRFYLVSSDIAPMKGTRAYLQLNTPASGVKSAIGFAEGDEPTGIASIENGKWKMENDGAVYDLQGRKVADNSQFSTFNFQLKQGLYIVNGKKVLR